MPTITAPTTALPRSFWQAAKRGILGRCPRCGEGRLFHAFLKPRDRCACCALDWTPQRADDFPAYVAILITGHVITPLAMFLVLGTEMGTGAITAIVLPLAAALMLGTLQPAKGGIIAMQWWNGMHGFVRERPPIQTALHTI